MADEKKNEKILHRRATNFSSVYASGVVSSLVPGSGLFNLTFYEDVVGICHETTFKVGENQAISIFEDGDLEPHREDKVRVSMRPETVLAVINLLKDQLQSIQVADNDTGN